MVSGLRRQQGRGHRGAPPGARPQPCTTHPRSSPLPRPTAHCLCSRAVLQARSHADVHRKTKILLAGRDITGVGEGRGDVRHLILLDGCKLPAATCHPCACCGRIGRMSRSTPMLMCRVIDADVRHACSAGRSGRNLCIPEDVRGAPTGDRAKRLSSAATRPRVHRNPSMMARRCGALQSGYCVPPAGAPGQPVRRHTLVCTQR